MFTLFNMHKRYPRLKHIELPDVKQVTGELRSLIKKRESFRNFSNKTIDKKTLSDILYYSTGIIRPNPIEDTNPFRAYPSAGAKYPLEVYPLILNGQDISPGLYHYNPSAHCLEVLLQPVLPEEIDPLWIERQQWFKKASVVLLITAVFHRTTNKYGEKGIMFPYIESGHLVQNVYLLTTSLGIGCCAIGQLNEEPVIKLLDINPRDEYPVYYVALGG